MSETMTNLEKDTISRNRIVSEIDTNFFVEAGAGSGKTTMLVSRMVAMVEAGIDISKISAITFTKAAAGEFYERFQKLLIDRSNPDYEWKDKKQAGQLPKPTDETRTRCAEALKNIDLCFMGTIDSFCNMILSEHPSEAGILSDASIVSDGEAASIYRQQYVKISRGEYGEDLAALSRTFRSFYWNAEEVFEQGMALIMERRNFQFHYDDKLVNDLDKLLKVQREEVVPALKYLKDHPELMYDGNKDSVEAWDNIGEIYKRLNIRWDGRISDVLFGLSKLENLRVIKGAADSVLCLQTALAPGGKQGKWLEFRAIQKGELKEKIDNTKYNLSMHFLMKCVPIMERVMRDQGRLSFFDYLYYLRNMLQKDAKKDGKLIRYIYDRHSYFLIDEFQDTNPMQAEVFFYLASEHPVEEWSKCVPRPGSLFIVGDPKQSIYRFRSADVTSFLRVKRLFEESGGAILSLSRNFRSTKTLCQYFNRVFTAMLPEETEDQSKYEEIPLPEDRPDEFQGIFTYDACNNGLPEEADCVQIGEIIKRLVDREEYKITTQDDPELRKLKFSDFMIITYGKDSLRPIMNYLGDLDIPSKVEGQVPFGESIALYEISLIYAAVADAEDKIALYDVLTGSIFRCTQDDIMRYVAEGGELSVVARKKVEDSDDNLTDKDIMTDDEPITQEKEVYLRVSNAIEQLSKIYQASLRLSPAALFSKIMDEFRVFAEVEATNMEVVYYTLELLRTAEKNGTVVSIQNGRDFIRGLLAEESGEERCLSFKDDRDCVHMANLHKVKGLEAPVVILAAAAKKTPSTRTRFVHGEDRSDGYIFTLEKENDEGHKIPYFSTDQFSDEKDLEKKALEAEVKRLIYVAATRARNVLILCNRRTASGSRNSKWEPIMEGDLPDIFQSISEPADNEFKPKEAVRATKLYEEAEETTILKDRSCEEETYSLENPSRLRISSKLADEQIISWTEDETEEDENATQDDPAYDVDDASIDGENVKPIKSGEAMLIRGFGALLGTMTHKLMEMLVSTKNTVDSKVAVSEIIREYRTPSTEPFELQMTKALSKVADTIKQGGYTQRNDAPTDILNTLLAADEVYCEVPFCYKEDSPQGRILWNGIMDVVYCAEGKWHIIDYKTNSDGNALDTKYKAQLASYVKAFKATTGNDADALIYHIDV